MISVIIPCYPPHFNKMPTILSDVQKQTVQPIEIIVAMSQTTDERALILKEAWHKFVDVPLSVVNIQRPQMAGINRNMGATHAKGTHLMFIDADDRIHRQKIEVTEYLIKKYDPNIILHSFFFKKNIKELNFEIDLEKIEPVQNQTLFDRTFGNPPKRNNEYERTVGNGRTNVMCPFRIHHGFPVVKREIWEKVRYTNWPRGEDGKFCRDILWNIGGMIAIPEILMVYKPI